MSEQQTEQSRNTSAANAPVSGENAKAAGLEKKNYKKTVVIFTLTATVMVAGGIYLLQMLQGIKYSAVALADNTVAQNEKINSRLNDLQNQIEDLRTQINGLSQSMDSMQQQPGNNEDWALAEVEYLLVIATHRLVLEQNPDTALAAMEAAALRLKDMDDEGLNPVREQLVMDMDRLREFDQVDSSALSIYLADLIERAASLPLKEDVIEKPAQSQVPDAAVIPEQKVSGLQGLLGSVWQDLKGLVVIKHKGEARRALLLPEEEYFLYQNLRLELENARLAVLHRDTANLHTSVTLLTDWLNEYFNTADTAVANVLETLKKMSTLHLNPVLPDIASSLETLRAYMRQREMDHPDTGSEVPPA